jgi:glycine cleavage system H protein
MTALRFTKDHEWVRLHDGIATVGIAPDAQAALGDIVFIELPDVGRAVDESEACAVVESVKAASDVFAPLAGVITERNDRIVDDPALVNRDPMGEGWFFRLEVADATAFERLMDEATYNGSVGKL